MHGILDRRHNIIAHMAEEYGSNFLEFKPHIIELCLITWLDLDLSLSVVF